MYVYFNPNPKDKRVGDCVVRAICKATDQDWREVYTQICLKGLEMCDMPSSNSVWSAYLKSIGFIQIPISNTCPNCYTVDDFCNDHPKGTFILSTGTHVVTIIDGCAFDAWNSCSETPISYFIRR